MKKTIIILLAFFALSCKEKEFVSPCYDINISRKTIRFEGGVQVGLPEISTIDTLVCTDKFFGFPVDFLTGGITYELSRSKTHTTYTTLLAKQH